MGCSVGCGVRRTGAAVGVSGSTVGSLVSYSVLRVGEGVVGPKTMVGMTGKDGTGARVLGAGVASNAGAWDQEGSAVG